MNKQKRLTVAEKTVLLAKELYEPNYRGFFFEAGANNGVLQSNTLFLEEMGWNGVLVEPAPDSFIELKLNRPKATCVNVALVSDEETEDVKGTFARGSLLGTINPEFQERDRTVRIELPKILNRLNKFRTFRRLNSKIELVTVRAKTLDRVFEEVDVPNIDFFFLDVEGYELEVLSGFSFSIKPRIVIIETRTSNLQSIAEILLARGYVCAANFSGFSKLHDPIWAGDHQDFAWCLHTDVKAIEALNELQYL